MRAFRQLYATRLFAQAADGCFQIALGSYVFFDPSKAATPTKAAAAFAVLLLPYSFVGPFSGVLLDRWSRQRILAWSGAVRAVMVLGVAALVANGRDGTEFFIAALAMLSASRFVLSAHSAALPHVVDADELLMGNSVAATSGTVATIAGGGLGAVVRQWGGSGHGANASVMVLAAGGYIASGLVATVIARQALGPDDFERVRHVGLVATTRAVAHDLVSGARHVWSRRIAGYSLCAVAAHRFCYGLATVATVLLYRNYFPGGSDDDGFGGLALVIGAAGVGYVLAAWITPWATRRVSKQTVITSMLIAAGVVQTAFGVPYRRPAIVVGAFFLGVIAQAVKICVDTVVQEQIDDDFRGRVFSLYDVAFNVAFVSAAAVGVIVLPESGRSYLSLAVVAVGYTATGITYGLAVRRLGRRSADDSGESGQDGESGDDVGGGGVSDRAGATAGTTARAPGGCDLAAGPSPAAGSVPTGTGSAG
jgi:MFS family permease